MTGISVNHTGRVVISAESYERLVSCVEAMAAWAGLSTERLESYYAPLRQDSGSESHRLKSATMMRQFAISLQNSGRMHNVVKLTNDNEKVSRGRSATSKHRGGAHPGLSQGMRLPLGFEA